MESKIFIHGKLNDMFEPIKKIKNSFSSSSLSIFVVIVIQMQSPSAPFRLSAGRASHSMNLFGTNKMRAYSKWNDIFHIFNQNEIYVLSIETQ